MEQKLVLDAQNICKNYSNHVALNNVNISVPQGSIFGLLGPNGAGKSTFIRIVNRIIYPDSGTILINNEPLSEKHVLALGYLPEERGLYKKMKVGEHLLYFAQLRGLTKSDATQKAKSKLKDFEASDWWNKKVEDLSKGMQQKVQFIATILHEPNLIILDEPFSGFDPLNADLIKNEILKLKASGCSIILSTHRMESVEELCDNIALIHKSQVILRGQTSEVKNRFRNYTFAVTYSGNLQENNLFTILEKNELTGFNSAKIKAQENVSNKELIEALLKQVELMEFREELPDMNQIFIQSVTQ